MQNIWTWQRETQHNNMHLPFLHRLLLFICLVYSVYALKEKEDLQYKVDIIDKPVKKEIRKQAEYDATYYEMTSAEGLKYDCYIPNPPDSETSTNPAMIPTSSEIDSVLKELSSSCILRLSGWFTYEFCYHRHMSQFHQPAKEAPIEQMYYLGMYSESTPQGEIKNLNLDRTTISDGATISDMPYYSETYTDGTVCNIMPFLPREANINCRTTEIRYYCSIDKVNFIRETPREPSSCTYIVEIFTNHMCTFSVFKPKLNPLLNVMCFPHEGILL